MMVINQNILTKAGSFRGPVTLKFPHVCWDPQLLKCCEANGTFASYLTGKCVFPIASLKKQVSNFDAILESQDCQVKLHHVFFEGVCFQTKYVNIWQIIWLMGRIQETSWDGENTGIFLTRSTLQPCLPAWMYIVQKPGQKTIKVYSL